MDEKKKKKLLQERHLYWAFTEFFLESMEMAYLVGWHNIGQDA